MQDYSATTSNTKEDTATIKAKITSDSDSIEKAFKFLDLAEIAAKNLFNSKGTLIKVKSVAAPQKYFFENEKEKSYYKLIFNYVEIRDIEFTVCFSEELGEFNCPKVDEYCGLAAKPVNSRQAKIIIRFGYLMWLTMCAYNATKIPGSVSAYKPQLKSLKEEFFIDDIK